MWALVPCGTRCLSGDKDQLTRSQRDCFSLLRCQFCTEISLLVYVFIILIILIIIFPILLLLIIIIIIIITHKHIKMEFKLQEKEEEVITSHDLKSFHTCCHVAGKYLTIKPSNH